jgi:hypothetical protein
MVNDFVENRLMRICYATVMGLAVFAGPAPAETPAIETPQANVGGDAAVTRPDQYHLSLDVPALLFDVAATSPAPAAEGEETPGSDAELAKKLQNPVADLISVPFQYNLDFGIGPKNARKSTLNIQPVIPVSISRDWNVIIRTIVPVIYADSPAPGVPYEFGLGDTVQSFFFSPKAPVGGWIIGAGPVFLWPTATDPLLGSQKFGAGPTAVVLQQQHGWTYGMLVNHIWSFAGDAERDEVNATFMQPFITYTFPTYTTVGINTETTYDWRHDQWTVPINLFGAQLLRIGRLPVQFQLGGRYYAEAPSGGPDWGLRFAVTFLFPK